MTDAILAEALARVRDRIAEAAMRAHRKPEEIRLVAVSKTKPVEAVKAALRAGQLVFGENRVQEAAAKFPPLRAAHPAMELHIIGGLQTNKARDAVRIADVIETLDRPKLADALASAMEKENRRPALLIEVNTGAEPQKSGIPRADAAAFIAQCRDRFGEQIRGLMCVPRRSGPGAAFRVPRRPRRAPRPARAVDGHVRGFRGRHRPRRHLGSRRLGNFRGTASACPRWLNPFVSTDP